MVALFVIFANLACDRFLKGDAESSKANDVVKIEFKEGKCLKGVPDQLQKFLNDEADINEATLCVQKALRSFMELTRGEKADQYSSKELQDFFNEYLLQENKISANFQKDIMKLKVLVAGGSEETATRGELEKFAAFVAELGKVASSLQGSVKLLSLKADKALLDSDKIFNAKKKLHNLGNFVLENTKITDGNYQINDLIVFLEDLKSFIGNSQQLDEIFSWMPLINKTRSLLIGEAARLQTKNDWLEIKNWLVDSYATFLTYFYIVKEDEFKTPELKNNLIAFIDEVFQVIENSPTLKERKIFDAALVDAVLEEAMTRKMIDTTLSIDLIKESYRKAVVYFIDGTFAEGDLGAFKGITSSHIVALKSEYNIWKAGQVFLNRAFIESSPHQNLQSLLDFQSKVDGKGFPNIPVNDKEEYNRAWNDLRNLLSKRFVLLHDDSVRLVVQAQSAKSEVSFSGMSQMLLMRSAARLVLRGYGNYGERAIFERKISKERFVKLEKDFHEFAKATGLIDPDKSTSGQETYEQGNMLVYSSDGNEVLDSSELTELLSTLISGGKTILDFIYQDFAKASNCLTQRNDVFGRGIVADSCFFKQFKNEFGMYFPNLPNAVKYVESLTEAQFLEMYNALVEVGKSPRYQKGFLESGEIRTMSVILHFVEEIYLTYDKDRSGLLTKNEVLDSFPRFRSLIKKKFIELDPTGGWLAIDSNLQMAFLYLVYNGQVPNALDMIITWGKSFSGNFGEVNRLMIYKLLVTMKQILDEQNGKGLYSATKLNGSNSGLKNNDSGLFKSAPIGSVR